MNKTMTPTDTEVDRLGRFFSGQLTRTSSDLSHDIAERLRVARQLAMTHRKPVVQLRQAQNTHVDANGTLTASGDEGLGLWNVLASAVPLLALVLGLLAIQVAKEDRLILEIAATDSALLTDELPPHAYTDAGFAQFLKLNQNISERND
jgi:hypothetical protein